MEVLLYMIPTVHDAVCCNFACGSRSELLSKLESGVTLVVDRYAFSGAVFTAAKGIPGLDLEWSKVSPIRCNLHPTARGEGGRSRRRHLSLFVGSWLCV
jgi:hypothetical protein